ncbi:MAG: hypothetical protein ACI4PY_01345 [Akkermansia muciniphila]
MEKLNLDAIELQQVIVTLTITGSDGSAVDLSGYRVAAAYAGCTDPYNRKPMRKSWSCEPAADGSAFVCTAPGLTLANSPWFYAIYVTQVETGLEWAVVSGRVRLVPRVAGEGGTIAPASYAVQAECSPSAVVNVALDATVGSISETLAAMQAAALAAQQAAEEAAKAAEGTPSEVLTACEAQATAATQAAAAATASADRAAQQATEATNAATLAGDSADGAQASATLAAASAGTAQERAGDAAASATAAADSASAAAGSATAAAGSATAAQDAQTAAESARDTCVQSVAAIDSTVATHAASAATYDTLGHVKLGESVTAASAHAAKVTVDENGRLSVRKATTSVVGCVKLGTGVEVASDAGMVGTCSNGGLGVRKASSNSTSGVGCVRLATSITDAGDVAVTTAALVQSALHGSELDIMPDQSPSEGEWNGLLLPAEVLPGWPIRKITIPAFATAQTTPLYLAAYRSNGTTETRLGVSTAACTWEAGGSATWEFAGDIIIPAGYQLRLYLITEPANAGSTSCTVISGHVKSYYVPTGSCSVRYSGAWYGTRTPQLTLLSSAGHSSTAASTDTLGHVHLATGEDDTRATAVVTAAQFAALVARVAALENA